MIEGILYCFLIFGILHWGFLTVIAAMERRYMSVFKEYFFRQTMVPLSVAGGLMAGSVLAKMFFPDSISTDHTYSFIGGILLTSLTTYYFSK